MNIFLASTLIFLALLELTVALVIMGGMVIGGSNGGNNVNNPNYQINNQQYWRLGKCIRKFTVTGRGVDDSFEEPCSNQTPSTFLDSNFLIVGDPDKTELCLFTDAFAKMVLIRNGKCTLRTYHTANGKTTKIESPMDVSLCSEVKRKISEEQEKNRIYWEEWNRKFEARMRKAFPPGFPFHKTNGDESSCSSEENTNKAPYVNLLNGVNHGSKPPIMNSPTNFNLKLQPLTTSNIITLSPPSSPTSTSPAASSTTPNAPNTVNLNSATTNSRLSLETSFPPTNNKGQCQVKISVSGNGVRDSLLEPCSQNDVDLIARDNVLMFGNPKRNPFCLYSKEPNSLVVIKNKICTKKIYSTAKGITTSKKGPLTTSKCNGIKRTMANEMGRSKDKKPVKMSPPAPSSVQQISTGIQATSLTAAEDPINRQVYGMQSSMNFNNGNCQRDIEVLGRGIKDRFLAPCPPNEIPVSITTDTLLILTDSVGDLELFSDTWATLFVIQNGECTKRTYSTTNGETAVTPTSMTEAECIEVLEKMTNYYDNHMASQ